ncbi:hypothetical protein Ahia01_001056900, partial [Argonauta hians]
LMSSRCASLVLRLNNSFCRLPIKPSPQSPPNHVSQCQPRHLSFSRILLKDKGTDNPVDDDAPKQSVPEISEDLTDAVRKVAQSLPGDPVQTQSQLLQQLQSHNLLSETQKTQAAADVKPSVSIENLFAGIKVIKEEVSQPQGGNRRQFQASPTDKRMSQRTAPVRVESLKLFSGPGLGIFSKEDILPTPTAPAAKKSVWDEINEETLRMIPQLALNGFEEMVALTKEGKLWTFPINNDAGWEQELNTGFHEHVFLQDLIADFPQKGPIHRFMELVITGLSQNPYLTVQQKKDHVNWFKKYFEEKSYILKEELAMK